MRDDHADGDVAQLVEHLVRNQGVAGSNPVLSTSRQALKPHRYQHYGDDGDGKPNTVNVRS